MIFQLLISLLILGSGDEIKYRLIINKVPFGQLNQNLAKSYFYFPLKTFEKKWKRGRIRKIKIDNDQNFKVKKERLSWEPEYDRVQKWYYEPFRSRRWVEDFDSIELYLQFTKNVLSDFRDTLVLQGLSEHGPRWGISTGTTAIQFYDPRPVYGPDVVIDFQRLLFFHQINRRIQGSDSISYQTAYNVYLKELDFYLSKYPDGGPYFQSLEVLISENFHPINYNYYKYFKYYHPFPSFLIYMILARQKKISIYDLTSNRDVKSSFNQLVAWAIQDSKFNFSKMIEDMYLSFPTGNYNFFKPIFIEVCKAHGFTFEKFK